MAGVYRKKRRTEGPSKNEEKVQRARDAQAAQRPSNQVGARYPTVRSITVTLSFTGAQQQQLGSETRVLAAHDPCHFKVECPGRCGVGSFDLASKIEQIVAAGETVSQSSGVCAERLYAGSPDSCQCRLDCRVDVSYR